MLGGNHSLGDVVHPHEVAPIRGGHPPLDEQHLQSDLPIRPVPHRAIRVFEPGIFEIGGLQRPPLPDFFENGIQVAGPGRQHLLGRGPDVPPFHAPSKQSVVSHREYRRHVAPVLEHLPRPPYPIVEGVPVVGAKAGEEGQIVGPAEGVHRIELDDEGPIQHPPKMPDVDPAGRPGLGEALRGEGVTASLIDGDAAHGRARVTALPKWMT